MTVLKEKRLPDITFKPGAGAGTKDITTKDIKDRVATKKVSDVPAHSFGSDGVSKATSDLLQNFTKQSKQESQSWIQFGFDFICHSILLTIFFFLSIYKNIQLFYRRLHLKFLTLAYYPSKSPHLIRDDVNKLPKIPKRISCILDLKEEDDENGGIDGLINQISEITAWTLSAGIPFLSIYEYNGTLVGQHKLYMPLLTKYISRNLANYFGTDNLPKYCIKIPHINLVFYSDVTSKAVDLEISLLSRVDGKPTIVELTKTMSELAVNKELSVKDISIDLIDGELVDLVGHEPDLLISFGPYLDLQDYPPWHIRLSELYWEPDNKEVSYAVFIRALQKYAFCKVNVGK